MLTTTPAWVSLGPMDFVNAASQGARLGLERAGLETQANDAAQRLQLGYANIAGENSRNAATIAGENSRNATNANIASAARALEQARLDFAIDQAGKKLAQQQSAADALNLYRFGMLGVRNRHEDNTEYGNKLRKYMHVGNQVVDLSGDQPVSVFAGPAQIDPYERMDYQSALRRYQNAQTALNHGLANNEDLGKYQKELQDAKFELDKLRNKRKGFSAADALNGWDQMPSAWDSQFAKPATDALDESHAPGAGVNPDDKDPLGLFNSDGSFSVGKYRVTPLK